MSVEMVIGGWPGQWSRCSDCNGKAGLLGEQSLLCKQFQRQQALQPRFA